jgi:hypothetical protein
MVKSQLEQVDVGRGEAQEPIEPKGQVFVRRKITII